MMLDRPAPAYVAASLLAISLWACAPTDGGRTDDSDGQPNPDASAADMDPLSDAADAGPGEPAMDAAPDPGPPGPAEEPRFAFPVEPGDRALIHRGLFFGVDHDPADGNDTDCLGYDGRGFPFCYDGHRGNDFVLSGGFVTMDAGSAHVVAAAGGRVVEAIDGHYDRCSGNLEMFEPTCDGHLIRSNTVVIEHANGWQTRYLHLMQGSVAVAVGDRVNCGDPLGLIGSSGRSYTPHLHFEVRDRGGASADPFSGEFNPRQSLWAEQRADDDLPGAVCDPAWGPAR